MIKITKPGNKIFNAKCGKCGCEFTYELGDLEFGAPNYVQCPECNEKYSHPYQNKKWATEPLNQPPFGTTKDSITIDEFLKCNHEWECCGMSTAGTQYRCRKCGSMKTECNQCLTDRTFYVDYANPPFTFNSTSTEVNSNGNN